MKEKKQVSAVFVDLDGTVVNSLPVLKKLYFSFLKEFGVQGSEEEFQELNGPSLEEIFMILQKRHGIEMHPSTAFEHYHSLLLSFYSGEAQLFEGVKECLSYFKEKKMKVAVVTGAPYLAVETLLRVQGIDQFIDHIFTTSGKQIKGKPNPAIYRFSLKEMGLKPAEVIAIEDSLNGVFSATEAGIFTYQIFNQTAKNKIAKSENFSQVKDWQEVLKIFRRLYESV